jgi:DNA-binding CsgD family transcriptional regulator
MKPKAHEGWEAEDVMLSEVSARDLVGLLSPHLSNDERAVLDCLTDGLALREIGRRLGISHTMALRHRCKIAEMLIRLERRSARQCRNLRRSLEPFDSRKNEGCYKSDRDSSQHEGNVKSEKSLERYGMPVFMA